MSRYSPTMLVQEEQTVTYTLKEVVQRMDERFDKIDQKIESQGAELRASINKLDDKINSNFKWLLGIVFGSFIATMGMLVTMFIFIYSLKPLNDVKNGVKTATAADGSINSPTMLSLSAWPGENKLQKILRLR